MKVYFPHSNMMQNIESSDHIDPAIYNNYIYLLKIVFSFFYFIYYSNYCNIYYYTVEFAEVMITQLHSIQYTNSKVNTLLHASDHPWYVTL